MNYKDEIALRLEDGIKDGNTIKEWVVDFCEAHFSAEYTDLLLAHILQSDFNTH